MLSTRMVCGLQTKSRADRGVSAVMAVKAWTDAGRLGHTHREALGGVVHEHLGHEVHARRLQVGELGLQVLLRPLRELVPVLRSRPGRGESARHPCMRLGEARQCPILPGICGCLRGGSARYMRAAVYGNIAFAGQCTMMRTDRLSQVDLRLTRADIT